MELRLARHVRHPLGLIGVALLFDFLNGLHDAANSIATVVSTRVLRPQTAVIWAAFFNFIAFAVFGLHVAQTGRHGHRRRRASSTARDLRRADRRDRVERRSRGASGIPSSSSHALIGGLAGAGIAKAGFGAVVFGGLGKTAPASCCRRCSASCSRSCSC